MVKSAPQTTAPAMALFDLFKRRPARSAALIVRELAAATFALHPAALDRVVLRVDAKFVVRVMEVPALRDAPAPSETSAPEAQVARLSELVAELARSGRPVQGDEVIVMRDRVIWMPSVMPVRPPLA